MGKIELTTELWNAIREWRLQYKIKAKDLADHIGKSPAYISKLENGQIKKIDRDLLEKIVIFISGDKNSYEQFISTAMEAKTIDELNEYAWFQNYDTIERLIPIPSSLIDYIKDKMQELNMDSEALCNYINQNEDLNDNFIKSNNVNKSEMTYNVWHPYTGINSKGEKANSCFIIMKCDSNDIDKVLSKEVTKSNHTFIFAMVYHLLKQESRISNNNVDIKHIQEETTKVLWSHKFYSISDRNYYLAQSNSKTKVENLLSDFDLKNLELLKDLIGAIQFLSDHDVEYANEKLNGIIENTKLNVSFAFAFMAISLKPIQGISSTQKRELLQQINDLIINFAETLTTDEKIELY